MLKKNTSSTPLTIVGVGTIEPDETADVDIDHPSLEPVTDTKVRSTKKGGDDSNE
ncbi:hypothetical protein HWD35_10310 [Tsukamurella tyrosinosolvens]|uniref:hypothetical protein n=1 Tax=Tsukamurella tyrosinosolvens TaxID=57704 RepID=UPI001CE0DA4A|nr:hypothetical protein [Tsukamurella tyrosinosolvens]MCA4995104.1 hypothetical protein [Tsukamurella tyrosinosolvens]